MSGHECRVGPSARDAQPCCGQSPDTASLPRLLLAERRCPHAWEGVIVDGVHDDPLPALVSVGVVEDKGGGQLEAPSTSARRSTGSRDQVHRRRLARVPPLEGGRRGRGRRPGVRFLECGAVDQTPGCTTGKAPLPLPEMSPALHCRRSPLRRSSRASAGPSPAASAGPSPAASAVWAPAHLMLAAAGARPSM